MIADALDGTLNQADAAAFTRHQGECVLCAQMAKETQQGKAWMEYLAEEPEVPADLLQRILARTSEMPVTGAVEGLPAGIAAMGVATQPRPAWQRLAPRFSPRLSPLVRQVFEPRLMMTVAMAFFSIALTLNVTGIKLSEVKAADLRPSRLRANLTRQYYSTNEQVMKYYANLRLVYEMEARVKELRRTTEMVPRSSASPGDAPKPSPRDGSANPSGQAQPQNQNANPDQDRRTHLKDDAQSPAEMVHVSPRIELVPQTESEFPREVPASFHPAPYPAKSLENSKREVFRATTEDQAERSLV
jgi:hypothetical protein